MKVALASPPFPKSINDGLYQAEKLIKDAASKQAEIICFPESYIPGYPLEEHEVEKYTPEKLQAALDKVCELARDYSIAVIMPMDWYSTDGILNVAHVISSIGELLGYQAKTQLDPSEDRIWIAGKERNIFEVNKVKFGICICHEGFRYPETVRWAARQGATIVFHPHCSGSNVRGVQLVEWGNKNNPYYEKAMMMRALENTIYFASVNYAMRFHESGTALIGPDGTCIAHEAYGKEGVLVVDIDPSLATGLLAKRVKPGLYD
ncbi:MAG: carbon-nitrogen hydrolase family protein [Chitinophagaceae bacterium]|nr:carbon-nitrogen hydrolase family protein [Chitinophagaceae bacterium]